MAFPPPCIKAVSFSLVAVTNSHREVSPYSFKQTPYDFMGGTWRASLSLYSMKARDRDTFQRWLVSLEGQSASFELPSLDYSGPHGTLTENPVIAATASARAKTISITLSSGEALLPDDQITIDGHLHIVTSVTEKVGDDQQVTIWPRLREDVSLGHPIEALAPYATWVLANPENGFSLSRRFSMDTTLDLIEAI